MNKVPNYPGIITSITIPENNFTTTSFEAYTKAVAAEEVSRPEVGGHSSCETCPHNFECLSGAIPETLLVARTRDEQRIGISLPCIDEGKVRLIVVTDMELALAKLDNLAKILQKQEPECFPIQPMMEEDSHVWITTPSQPADITGTWVTSTTAAPQPFIYTGTITDEVQD